ncbi:MAG: ROK family protein [Acidimicrobiaceae bacterium]|nr:ROK family protein [Acidimicrobiaceae bacterium]MCY4293523.1 ROK family protein [Acidimicrobiaceae bacterium]
MPRTGSEPEATPRLLGALEAGGTKFRAAAVSSAGASGVLEIVDSVVVSTSDPDTTLAEVVEFFAAHREIAALGIASFGPVDLDESSPGHGSITGTPKPGWTGARILRRLAQALEVPAGIQTDVEAAAVAEQLLGPQQPPPDQLAYVTVGTGIGAAVAKNGEPLRGRRHSELGHIPVRRVDGDDYPGRCPFHRDCLEGMASGPAVAERWGIDPSEADERDEIWRLEAAYLAQLVRVLCYSVAPDRIVFGGGVGNRPAMADMIRDAGIVELAGYADYSLDLDCFIASPSLGDDSGLLGAALLARTRLSRH